MGFFNELGKKTTETTSKIAREAKLKMLLFFFWLNVYFLKKYSKIRQS